MSIALPAAAGAVMMLAAAPARAELLASWNFNTLTAPIPMTIPADVGSGVIDRSGWLGTVAAFGGTTVNALDGVLAGNSLRLSLTSTNAANGTGITLAFSMADMQDLTISYATNRPINTNGFQTQTWSWSTDGVNFTEAGVFDVTTLPNSTWTAVSMDFSSITALNDAETVTLRVVLDGGVPTTFGTAGSNAFDNIQIHANLIPAPGAPALLGAAGLLLTRRRRGGSPAAPKSVLT